MNLESLTFPLWISTGSLMEQAETVFLCVLYIYIYFFLKKLFNFPTHLYFNLKNLAIRSSRNNNFTIGFMRILSKFARGVRQRFFSGRNNFQTLNETGPLVPTILFYFTYSIRTEWSALTSRRAHVEFLYRSTCVAHTIDLEITGNVSGTTISVHRALFPSFFFSSFRPTWLERRFLDRIIRSFLLFVHPPPNRRLASEISF